MHFHWQLTLCCLTMIPTGRPGSTWTTARMGFPLPLHMLSRWTEREKSSGGQCAIQVKVVAKAEKKGRNLKENLWSRKALERPCDVREADYKGCIGGPRGYYFHVLVVTFTKWPEIALTNSTSSKKLFPVLDRLFATHLVPTEIKIISPLIAGRHGRNTPRS